MKKKGIEIHKIFMNGMNKGYPVKILKRWNEEVRRIANRPDTEVKEKKTYRNIRTTKMDRDIQKVLRPKGVEMVTRRNSTLYNVIRNDKDKRSATDTPGVYKVPLSRGDEKTACGKNTKIYLSKDRSAQRKY